MKRHVPPDRFDARQHDVADLRAFGAREQGVHARARHAAQGIRDADGTADARVQRFPDPELAGRIIVRHHHHSSGGSDQIDLQARGRYARTKPGHRVPRSDFAMPMPRTRNEWVTALFAGAPLPPVALAAQGTPLEAFRSNIAAIHARNRAAYLSHYLQSPELARVGPDGLRQGYDDFARGDGAAWPDTLVATHLRIVPLSPDVAYGVYRYRVVDSGGSVRGVSERVFVRTARGWKVAVTTAFPTPGATPPALALVGASLADGTGAAPVPDAVVVMREGRERARVRADGSRLEGRRDDRVPNARGHAARAGARGRESRRRHRRRTRAGRRRRDA